MPEGVDSRLRGNDVPRVTFERVSMGLWPTRGNENPRRPRAGGDPWRMDSRLRGNDESGRDFQERVPMGLWPTRGNESRAQEPRNGEWRYWKEIKQVNRHFSA